MDIGIEKENSCCFTGHRLLAAGERAQVRRLLRQEIQRMVADKGVDTFLAGGALGFDTIAAQEVVLARAAAPWVRLVLVLPCQGQEARWSPKDKAVYRTLLHEADSVLLLSEGYHDGCMFERNRFLADHSAYCLCYLRETASRGGTAYTVRYAGSHGVEVVNLAGEDGCAYGQLTI